MRRCVAYSCCFFAAAIAAPLLASVEVYAQAQAPLLDPGWQFASPGETGNGVNSGLIAHTFGSAPGQYAVPPGYRLVPANAAATSHQQQRHISQAVPQYYAIVPAQGLRAYRPPTQYYAIVPAQRPGRVQSTRVEPTPVSSETQPAELTTGQIRTYQPPLPQVTYQAPPQVAYQAPPQVAYQAPPQPGPQPFFLEQIFGRQDWAPAPAYAPAPAPEQSYEPYPQQRDPKFDRQIVDYPTGQAPGTIVIDTPHYFLYLVLDGGKALRYGIGVGRPGFTWAGIKEVSAKREWPDWRPPDEMLQRRPDLPRYMPGGPENPLGARAMYLGSTLYRIHGSNEPWTIGTQVSSGCIRLRNDDVIDLYGRVKVGTKVIVI
jgi:lipoprotein-anchoring transpeptidase ErfK/SrfK